LKSRDEDLDGDEGQFDCETCPLGAAVDDLDPENSEAWTLFSTLYCRLAADLPGVAGALLAKVIESRSSDEATDLMNRLNVIYDTVCPPKTP
jgi:hypothetical protein